MSSPFGDDSFDIEQELRKLLPETDPLQETKFFPHLAEDLSDARDAAAFDAAFESAMVAADTDDFGLYIPAHFDRRILLALCSNPKLLEAWARRHFSLVVIYEGGLGAMMRFLFWNRWLWPVELPFYVCLFLALGTGAIMGVYHLDLSVQAIQLGELFCVGYFFTAIVFLIMFGQAVIIWALPVSLLALFAPYWDKVWDRVRSKWALPRIQAREAKRQARKAAREAKRQAAQVKL